MMDDFYEGPNKQEINPQQQGERIRTGRAGMKFYMLTIIMVGTLVTYLGIAIVITNPVIVSMVGEISALIIISAMIMFMYGIVLWE